MTINGLRYLMPKLYDKLAAWWPLLSPPSHYDEEAAFFRKILVDSGIAQGSTMLELGCGGGNNASFLKHTFTMTLTDLSPAMLAISRALNPECDHVQGDMRSLRLNRQFDVVFAHDAVMYMSTTDDLRRAIETSFAHCKPDGTALFVPDYVRETFEPYTKHGGADTEERGLRYVDWTYDPDENDTTVISEMVYILREGKDKVRVEYDRHICGIFPRSTWLELFEQVGFEPRIKRDQFGRELFLGRKPAAKQ